MNCKAGGTKSGFQFSIYHTDVATLQKPYHISQRIPATFRAKSVALLRKLVFKDGLTRLKKIV